MKIRKIPTKVMVACSGGPDSMALLEYCRLGGKDVSALHIHHGTAASGDGLALVEQYCDKHHIPLSYDSTGLREIGKLPRVSNEQYWSQERARIYQAFLDMYKERTIITGHTLDDAMEWWLLSSFRGNPLLTSWYGVYTYRPALLVDRSELRRSRRRTQYHSLTIQLT